MTLIPSHDLPRAPLILADGDMLLYAATTSCLVEVELQRDQWTRWADLAKAREIVTSALLDIISFCGDEYDLVMCFTSPTSWRKSIYPDYKSNRRGRLKPIGYTRLKGEYLDTYGRQYSGLEADDIIGIYSSLHPDSWIVSGDKDLDQIPGRHYWPEITGKEARYWTVTEEEARRKFWIQALMGDSTDSIPGCPGVGEKKSDAVLKGCTTDLEYWEKTLQAYEKACGDKQLALSKAILTANLVRIMRSGDYDPTLEEPNQWMPPTP